MNPIFSLLTAFAILAIPFAEANEPFLKPNDVIALVGGEDMVALGESGYLEAQLQVSFPDYHLKVRSLAWEGDTVFEQPRMLNYPSLDQQLDEIGAAVVIMQFGQMESMAGESGVSSFAAAYDQLVRRLSGASQRRLVLVEPTPILVRDGSSVRTKSLGGYSRVVGDLEKTIQGVRCVGLSDLRAPRWTHRDNWHLDDSGQNGLASVIALSLGFRSWRTDAHEDEALKKAILQKNRLWERYRRPQNWAFLAGDRITQASSRDHRDPSKRWFPEEMKEFVPLIEAKDREIWDLAAKLAGEKK